MNGAKLRSSLHRQEWVYGTMLRSAQSFMGLAVLEQLGFDFVVIDNEHSPIGRAETASQIAALHRMEITPVVRLPSPEARHAYMAIDAGASGILAPYCETPDQAAEIVKAARYRPLKGKALERFLEAARRPAAVVEELHRRNADRVTMIGVETVPAVEEIEAILSIDGVDAIFVGMDDLTLSMGYPRQHDHPEVRAVLRRVIRACTRREIGVTLFNLDLDSTKRWMREGMRCVLHMTDDIALFRGYQAAFSTLREVAVRRPPKRSKRSKRSTRGAKGV